MEWEEGEDTQQYIQEEPPRVLFAPTSVRYRTFLRPLLEDEVRCSPNVSDFFVHKRRRFEARSDNADVTQPLLRIVRDPFDVAQRRLETYQWLECRRSPDEITARLALDRKLGAPPSLAVVNRALRFLGKEGYTDAALDIIEDVVVENGTVPSSTLIEVIRALSSQPIRATRLALTLHDIMGRGTVPVNVWTTLSSDLAKVSQQLPKPLDDHFLQLFERSLEMIRASGNALSETLIVAFGRCLLSSRKPLTSAVRLVQEELLSGRNRSGLGHTHLHLSAFLSDLLHSLCTTAVAAVQSGDRPPPSSQAAADTASSSALMGGSGGGTSAYSAQELLVFAGDVIKYAYARRIQLAPRAFDAVLDLCDATHSLYRLCISFTAMCVLSVPTLRSLWRTVEVVQQVPELRQPLHDVFRRGPSAFFLWCLQRFGSLLDVHTTSEQAARQALCAALGRMVAEDASTPCVVASQFNVLFAECGLGGAARFVEAFVSGYRHSPPLSKDKLQAAEAFNQRATDALFGSIEKDGDPHADPFGLSRRDSGRAYLTIETALARALPGPQVYCNVLSVSTVNTLAESVGAQEAFARMMSAYVGKSGAIAIVPIETLCPYFGITEKATALLRSWRVRYSSWFAVLPLSLSAQLRGCSEWEVCCDLFFRVHQVGHKRVGFVTNNAQDATAAKEKGVQPVILLDELLKRLGGATQ